MKILILLLFTYLMTIPVIAQQKQVSGRVVEKDEHGHHTPVPYANVYWEGTTTGVMTGETGNFKIEFPGNQKNSRLIISYVGYANDTIEVPANQNSIEIVLSHSREIDAVKITSRLGGTYISKLQPLKTEVITTEGLQKLACCNLSESFENNATVDVGFSDAVTGAKHIQMLGLAGVYSQLLAENIPAVRGLSSTYGLTYIPGSWMESVQISKGTSSVVNGYESTTGQINIEFKKPETSDPLFVNLYGSSKLRSEANITAAKQLSERWYTMLLAHGSYLNHKSDENGDSFINTPLSKQVNLYNRWKYDHHEKMESQIGVKFMYESRRGGQMGFSNYDNPASDNLYGIGIDTRNFNIYTKTGFVLPSKPDQSIGIIISGTAHEQDAFYGLNSYFGKQLTVYANVIFQSVFSNTNHKYRTGLSLMADNFTERFKQYGFDREEIVPGAFFEYNYSYLDKLNIIGGVRADYNTFYGAMFTPRLHFRYNTDENLVFRGSAGKGYRSVNIFAENTGILASSRNLVFEEDARLEEAWNFGLNVTKDFPLTYQRKITWSADFYRTLFKNQYVVDLERDVRQVYFYNLNGRSYSNSFQTDLRVEPLQRFEITAAFRVNDVKMTIDDELREKPLVSKYKGLLTLSYSTPFRIWQFDITNQFNGRSRLPGTENNPVVYQRPGFSPPYIIIHAQITKRFKTFDLYAGVENLTGFIQENPIIAADDPFGEYFDASMVWGPLMGRMFYAGLRYSLK
ncbi:MAG: TonB-dependent receptor [Bacteroidales bacterium]|nr:TonB-dependent receptor [Bacteroidales bacterium]